MVLFHSTNYNTPDVGLKEAIFKGQAFDKGLYMLNTIPILSESTIHSFINLKFNQISNIILLKLFGKVIPETDLKKIIADALDFKIPVEKINNFDYIMFLDRGPTCSFKDIGARTLARVMEYFLNLEEKDMVILTATSGDTGGAVASAFYKKKRIKVIILYPRNEISDLQRKQMTTLGKNIIAIGIDGKFDDCQRYVKTAFADKNLQFLNLTSANSINVGRLLPQTLYYFWAYSRVVKEINEKVIFVVPSGNFGNLIGGLIAYRMGLPVKKFISAVNENDEFPLYLRRGIYQKVEPSKHCISSAMNVGHPSNFARLIDLYGGIIDETGLIHKNPDLEKIREDIFAISINDESTRRTIKSFYQKYNKIIEPHGAVGWAALQKYRKDNLRFYKIKAISLETADPAKFPDEIISLIEITPKIPKSLEAIKNRVEFPNPIEIEKYEDFKSYLLKNF